jgi:uncharacterized iron-regulated membrane protein
MALLFDLHAHLMAGETGERVGGVIGLLGVVLAVTGLVLWWPARRRLSLANLVPRDLSRRTLLIWHRDVGAVTSPILLVLLLTGSGLVFYYPPLGGASVHRFRLKQPCELHPNGRSYISLDFTGDIVQETDACALPPGERSAHAIYPLHAGKADSDVYKLAVFLGAVALAILSVSGAVSYLKKLRWM